MTNIENKYGVDYGMMDDSFCYVPPHMRDSFKLWIENGINAGSFGMAVLTNDLKEAIGRADDINKEHLPSIVAWLYNYAPSDCWGSVENVENWRKKARD